jgi:Pectate lyase superfamily protein
MRQIVWSLLAILLIPAPVGAQIGGSVLGSQGSSDKIVNVVNFGADNTGSRDSMSAFESVTAKACAYNPSGNHLGAQIYLPAGRYLLSRPWVIPCSSVTVVGAGRATSVLEAGYYAGYTVIIEHQAQRGLSLRRPLINGSGGALSFTESPADPYLNLNDVKDIQYPSLDHKDALTIELVYNLRNRHCRTLVSSGGSLLSNGKTGGVFAIDTCGPAGQLRCSINTRAGLKVVNDAENIVVNQTRWAACVFSGSTLGLYEAKPGARVGYTAVTFSRTSTIQNPWEVATIGPAVQRGPVDGPFSQLGPNGTIDGIRISRVAHFSPATIAPTSLPEADGATLFLWSGLVASHGQLAKVLSQHGTSWLPVRWSGGFSVINEIGLDNFGIVGGVSGGSSGLFMTGCINCWIRDFGAGSERVSSVVNGIYLFNNNYQSYFDNIIDYANGQIGLGAAIANGVEQFNHLFVNGPVIGIAYDSGSALFNSLEVGEQVGTQYFVILRGEGDNEQFQFDGAIFDAEGGGSMQAAIVASDLNSLNLIGGNLDSDDAAPILLIDGNTEVNLFGAVSNYRTPTPYAIKFNNPSGNTRLNVFGYRTKTNTPALAAPGDLRYVRQ